MNYYNPYLYGMPTYNMSSINRIGLFRRMFGNINMESILNGTQRTLSIVNQTIPLIRQVQPILRNAKTMFKVMNEFKKMDTPNKEIKVEDNKKIRPIYSEGPTFFL